MSNIFFPGILSSTTIGEVAAFNNELSKIVDILKPYLLPEVWIFLEGDIGAGKTTLVQAMLAHMESGCSTTSPTFSILNKINLVNNELIRSLIHIDFYRIKSGSELPYLGIEAELDNNTMVVTEWASLIEQKSWEDFFNVTSCNKPAYIIEVNIEYPSLGNDVRHYKIIKHEINTFE